MPHIVYMTRFKADPTGDGGHKRAAQIAALVESVGGSCVSVQRPGEVLRGTRLSAALRGRYTPVVRWLVRRAVAGGAGLWSELQRNYFVDQTCAAYEWGLQWKRSGRPDVVVVDDPHFCVPLIRRLRRLGVAVVGASHNLDALTPWEVRSDCQIKALDRELAAYRMCDFVITVSREEDLLLSCFGLDVEFLPYFPVRESLSELRQIRARRLEAQKRDVLFLGTAHNRATADGMIQACEHWHAAGGLSRFGTLRVAGYGTQRIASGLSGLDGVEVLGPLDSAQLEEELVRTHALLCFQEGGAGALTRIPEQLIAGVPVIANRYAARSHFGLDGLIVFDSWDGLSESLDRLGQLPAEFGEPAKPSTAAIEARLKQLSVNPECEGRS